jgi:hypothetical protein
VGHGTVRFRVHNAAPLRVTVVGLTTGDLRVDIRTVRVDGSDLAKGTVGLGGGADADIEVDYAGDCRQPHPPGDEPSMRLAVRTLPGLERSVTVVDWIELAGLACT